MSEYDICNSTPEAKKKTAGEIPYAEMIPGQSVFVKDNVRQDSLRSVVSHGSKKHNKLFKVIHLKDKGYYEVACIDDLSFTTKAAYSIVPSSDEAKNKFFSDLGGSKRYPFDELSEGFSFAVPFAEGNEPSMRVQCSTWGKRLGKKLIVLRHESIGMFEVACIASKPIQFLPNSELAIAKANAVQTEPAPVVSPAEAFMAAPQTEPSFKFFTEPATEVDYEME